MNRCGRASTSRTFQFTHKNVIYFGVWHEICMNGWMLVGMPVKSLLSSVQTQLRKNAKLEQKHICRVRSGARGRRLLCRVAEKLAASLAGCLPAAAIKLRIPCRDK
ncbi:unnamed protein product [Ceratitis capitata]|uniref:(Mediterranean fruit fly) hypothetical protein n=1 Tax=Ceratitis capitata TaxID=7213 RepID=A0A811U468_CERCA|nr:unnamed protein product [Ceratitis capitata]